MEHFYIHPLIYPHFMLSQEEEYIKQQPTNSCGKFDSGALMSSIT